MEKISRTPEIQVLDSTTITIMQIRELSAQIDEHFEESGYSKKHPALLAGASIAAAISHLTGMTIENDQDNQEILSDISAAFSKFLDLYDVFGDGNEKIANSIEELACKIGGKNE